MDNDYYRKGLNGEILAALAINGTDTAAGLARRCPAATEVHSVSVRLYEMVRAGLIERAPGGGKPRYRNLPAANPEQESFLRVGSRSQKNTQACTNIPC